jgi:hypothetical protein
MLYTFGKELHVSLLYYILTTLLHIGLGMEHRELHEQLLVCRMKVESILVRLSVFFFLGGKFCDLAKMVTIHRRI